MVKQEWNNMDKSSERRLVENELLFRDANTKVQERVKLDNRSHQIPKNLKLHFYCECSNFHCRDRIMITATAYERAHKSRFHFITLPGHENAAVEKIVGGNHVYTVVEKFIDPAKVAAGRS